MFVPTKAEGVPSAGDTNVGLFDSTLAPEPVLVVTPVPPLATGSVPVTPVVIGRPVQLVNVPDVGVPKIGDTKVGAFANTTPPVPVEAVVDPVPPLATGRVPVTPVVNGNPVALVRTTADGMPNAGVVNTGLDARTTEPVPVTVVTPVPPDVTANGLTNAASVATNTGVTNDVEYMLAQDTFTPSLNTTALIVVGTATPVPVEFLTVIVSAVSFCIKYCFSMAGTINSLAPAVVPVSLKRRLRAVCVPFVFDRVRVTLALAKVTFAEPVIASSIAVPRLTFVVDPHVPDCSPVVISSILSGE
jgi:hypothetical protein